MLTQEQENDLMLEIKCFIADRTNAMPFTLEIDKTKSGHSMPLKIITQDIVGKETDNYFYIYVDVSGDTNELRIGISVIGEEEYIINNDISQINKYRIIIDLYRYFEEYCTFFKEILKKYFNMDVHISKE